MIFEQRPDPLVLGGRRIRNVVNSKLWQQLAIATNWPVLVAVAMLSSLGVISIWADKQEEGEKQLVFLAVAIGCMALFQAVNYAKIGRFAWGFYLFSLLLISYTVVAEKVHGLPCCHEIKGVYAWLSFGSGSASVSLEPAELMKIAFVLLLARYLRFRSNYRTLRGLLAPFALALVPIILILKQPDLGMAMLFLPVLFAMLFVAGAKFRHLCAIAGLGAVLAPIVWFSGAENVPVLRHLPQIVKDYQKQRVYSFLNSDNPAERQARAYQTYRAMVAFASGGVSGKGFGNIPVGQSVPEAHDDMIMRADRRTIWFLWVGGIARLIHRSLRGWHRDICLDPRTVRPIDRGGSGSRPGHADIHQSAGRLRPYAGDGDHLAIRQLWGKQSCRELYGGWPAFECGTKPAPGDGARIVSIRVNSPSATD